MPTKDKNSSNKNITIHSSIFIQQAGTSFFNFRGFSDFAQIRVVASSNQRELKRVVARLPAVGVFPNGRICSFGMSLDSCFQSEPSFSNVNFVTVLAFCPIDPLSRGVPWVGTDELTSKFTDWSITHRSVEVHSVCPSPSFPCSRNLPRHALDIGRKIGWIVSGLFGADGLSILKAAVWWSRLRGQQERQCVDTLCWRHYVRLRKRYFLRLPQIKESSEQSAQFYTVHRRSWERKGTCFPTSSFVRKKRVTYQHTALPFTGSLQTWTSTSDGIQPILWRRNSGPSTHSSGQPKESARHSHRIYNKRNPKKKNLFFQNANNNFMKKL